MVTVRVRATVRVTVRVRATVRVTVRVRVALESQLGPGFAFNKVWLSRGSGGWR